MYYPVIARLKILFLLFWINAIIIIRYNIKNKDKHPNVFPSV